MQRIKRKAPQFAVCLNYYYQNTNTAIFLFKSQDRPLPTSINLGVPIYTPGCRVDSEQFLFSSKIAELKRRERGSVTVSVTCERRCRRRLAASPLSARMSC